MRRDSSRNILGFSILELIVAVAIISILAATAVPLVSRYLKKAKTSEVGLNLRKIYDGEVAYFQEEQATREGGVITRRFIALSRTPETPGPNKQMGNFETPGWQAIKFSSDGPLLYSYSVDAAGQGTTARFTARAEGDLNGDGFFSLYERTGEFSSAVGDIVGGAGLFSLDEIE